MKRLIAMIAFAATGPAFAVPGGELDTLPRGLFVCELPGDANGSVGQLVPEADFAISNDSTYQTDLGYGAYLVTGDQVTMTSGPLRGDRFRRVSDRFLRKLDAAGKETIYILNYKAIEEGSATTMTGTVAPGDVFIIPPSHLFE